MEETADLALENFFSSPVVDVVLLVTPDLEEQQEADTQHASKSEELLEADTHHESESEMFMQVNKKFEGQSEELVCHIINM